MRLLILSNFYPPSRSWGYTQLCHEVSQRLAKRGHTIAVLTSDYLAGQATDDKESIFRLLHLESDPFNYQPLSFFTRYGQQQKQNRLALTYITKQFRPDIIFIWGMWNMCKEIAALAESLEGVKVVYYLSDHWPVHESPHDVYWRLPARHRFLQPVKHLLNRAALGWLARQGKPPALKYEHAICVSRTLRDSLVEKGAPVEHATIIYNGIDVTTFANYEHQAEIHPQTNGCLRLLYAGRLSHDKGVHTAVNALAHLVHGQQFNNVRLTVVGDGSPDYVQSLHHLVSRHDLGDYVRFQAVVTREEMPELLRRFDVLIFPSIAAEALPRMPQEAMACGLVVVGTTTGGTQELLLEEENGLTFAPDDDRTLAAQLLRLVTEPDLRQRLAHNGRQTVLEKFTIDRMVDELENYLNNAHSLSN